MLTQHNHIVNEFWIAGVNYKRTDACARGEFAINPEQYNQLLSLAPDFGVKDLFVLSTCNRTEIYGIAETSEHLTNLLCNVCHGNKETFDSLAYVKKGNEAIEHLFKVAAGLDSQILGDFEILGQIKIAVKQAKAKGFINTYLERLLNCVMQSSKSVKTNTELSGGTVSVSFAAVQFIKENVQSINEKKIALVGTGKIGKSTCRNLIHYLDTHNITLLNRTAETAFDMAKELNLKSAPIENLSAEISSSEIIIVSTNAQEPVILKEHLVGCGPKLIIDLSVPCNVDPAAASLPGITLLNVDLLSRIKDETLEKRKLEVPKALNIIEEHIAEFNEWCDMRKHVPVLKEVKNKLKSIHIDAALLQNCFNTKEEVAKEQTIQSVINVLATKMRKYNAPGCHYIEAINDYIAYHA